MERTSEEERKKYFLSSSGRLGRGQTRGGDSVGIPPESSPPHLPPPFFLKSMMGRGRRLLPLRLHSPASSLCAPEREREREREGQGGSEEVLVTACLDSLRSLLRFSSRDTPKTRLGLLTRGTDSRTSFVLHRSPKRTWMSLRRKGGILERLFFVYLFHIAWYVALLDLEGGTSEKCALIQMPELRLLQHLMMWIKWQ